MIERLDSLWERGDTLIYKDLGKVGKGRKTKVFSVQSRFNSVYLGRVAWYAQWRQYVFFPESNMIFDKKCMREISDYCELKTSEHRAARSQT